MMYEPAGKLTDENTIVIHLNGAAAFVSCQNDNTVEIKFTMMNIKLPFSNHFVQYCGLSCKISYLMTVLNLILSRNSWI